MTPSPISFSRLNSGTTLIEVLVTFVIVAVGLLGAVGLQTRLQMSDMDAYQRAQALILLNDMTSRLSTNRKDAASYVTGVTNPLGSGVNCPTDTSTLQKTDAGEWCEALQGAAETSGENKMGAMIGGRGCIESPVSGQYIITVAWQGTVPLAAPPNAIGCGKDLYDGGDDSNCKNDLCRRVITATVRVGIL